MKQFSYYNPVKIEFGTGSIAKLSQLTQDQRVLLVTTPGAAKRGAVKLVSDLADVVAVIDDVEPNPTFKYLESKFAQLQDLEYDVIVALGGGSVLDSAKAFSVTPDDHRFDSLEKLIKQTDKVLYSTTPVIAIPTTAGTGSEVTPWATIWDMDDAKKYSLHLPDTWPQTCICDPQLTLSMPWELTLHTGLDALSHSLESIWNINANPISTGYAIAAAKEIYDSLPLLQVSLDDIVLREKMMLAALNAGLAFSNTKTAIAHAISYYITARKGISHGLACSFTLPQILEVAMEDQEVASAAHKIFGLDPIAAIRHFFAKLNVSTDFSTYGVSPQEKVLIWETLNQSRAGNSLIDPEKLLRASN